MAQVPESPQINPESFPKDDRDLVTRISGPITEYTELLNEGLNQNLTFEENFRGEFRTLTFDKGKTTEKFKYKGKGTPIGLWVVDQSNITSPSTINTNSVQIQWNWDGKGNINVTNVVGLEAEYKYNLTVIIIAR